MPAGKLLKVLRDTEGALAQAMRDGIEPGAAAIQPLIARHHAWVTTMWERPCSPKAYAGLANLYLAHPDFVDRYERMEVGFATYLSQAMKVYAERGR